MAAVVCQIPGCKTTQAEIEVELQSYLGGYCETCEKQREGRLCGCAFPCSLTFKGQMLNMIHSLLGLSCQQGMKQINVCYKHPELLRQARDRCISNRDGSSSSLLPSEKKNKPLVRLEKKTEEISFSLDSLGDGDPVLGLEGGAAAGVTGLDNAGTVTSIVYTDEGGRQQKMVGKIVYQTDEKGQSNIIIQEVEEGEDTGDKLMKINLSDIDGYMQQMDNKQVEEEMEQRLEEEMEGREARIEEELDFEASAVEEQEADEEERKVREVQVVTDGPATDQIVTSGVGGFSGLGGNTVIQISENLDTNTNVLFSGEQGDTITLLENYSEPEPTFQLTSSQIKPKKLIPIFPKSDPPTQVQVLGVSSKQPQKPNIFSVPGNRASVGITSSPESEILKIQYKEYNSKVLVSSLESLSNCEQLCDTVLVCSDGKVLTSSLLLTPIIPWLSDLLDSILRIDAYKTVILPREVSVSSVQLMVEMVTSPGTRSYTASQVRGLRQVCSVLDCRTVLDLLPPLQGLSPPHSAEAVKRKATSSPAKRKAKQARGLTAASSSLSSVPAGVKLEKSDLNADYMDSSGLVRLSSSDEMAMHYCLLCDGKFKKYNQAITHYDTAHSLLAALSCDMCSETFRDMYTCVKHKHEVHGQFDVNFQCYICKEVLYSRFRLGTHIKESHKAHYGQFSCRACGMKFAAQYYLTIHQKESHSDTANTCNICNKTFSGKRYLTMHIKANHESQYGGGDDLVCKDCDRVFPSTRDRAYHASKSHGGPRPDGTFEDCNQCDKWFSSSGELSQHQSRIHNKSLQESR